MRQPRRRAWAAAGEELRLVEQTVPRDDPGPKALACYGLLVSCPAAAETLPAQVWLRFVEERPISAVTTPHLAWCCAKLEEGQAGVAHDLGQRLLARQQSRAPLDSGAQS